MPSRPVTCRQVFFGADRLAATVADVPVREATPGDVGEICALIKELAAYEQLTDDATFNPADIRQYLFDPHPVAQVTIAEDATPRRQVAGFALWYPTFSTFLGVPGLWLEDLYIRPVFRGRGLGRELLDDLRRRTEGRLEWAVLDWNEAAIGFYQRLGARPVDGWTRYRWGPSRTA
jgi:GNAT superfamily N-acetyltransferase